MTSQHHQLGRMRVCLSNSKEHYASCASFSTKHSSVRLLGGCKAWLRASPTLAEALTLQRNGRTCLYWAAVQSFAKCWPANLCIGFHCTLWTCQNIDPINFKTLTKCARFYLCFHRMREKQL